MREELLDKIIENLEHTNDYFLKCILAKFPVDICS